MAEPDPAREGGVEPVVPSALFTDASDMVCVGDGARGFVGSLDDEPLSAPTPFPPSVTAAAQAAAIAAGVCGVPTEVEVGEAMPPWATTAGLGCKLGVGAWSGVTKSAWTYATSQNALNPFEICTNIGNPLVT